LSALHQGPISPQDLRGVCEFLAGRDLGAQAAAPGATLAGVDELERDLRGKLWDNPAAGGRRPAGFCLREGQGRVVGALLCFPASFVLSGRTLVGLCGSGFYVEPQFRLQGFFLFRRFLAAEEVDFWFATTCNAASGAMWSKHGGQPVEYSNEEHVFVLRAGPFVEEALLRRGHGRRLAGLGRSLARVVPPLRLGRRGARGITFAPCRDWDKLAALAERHRDREALSARRSALDLRWRYEGAARSATHEILLFGDGRGAEGWVSLGAHRRGRAGQIRSLMVLDLVHPRGAFDLSLLLAALLSRFGDRADMVAVRGPDAIGRHARAAGARTRRFDGPTSYVIERRDAAASGLARIAELFPADGDTAS
jgi:hypothetical protein